MTPAIHHRFIEPLDCLFLRGNKLFGSPGSFGESLVPPWPSVAAGALRSAMLAHEGADLTAFGGGTLSHTLLGTPQAPGPFVVTAFSLARRVSGGDVESLHPLPADLHVQADAEGRPVDLRRLQPLPPAAGLASSAPLPLWPVLPQRDRAKPVTDVWLTQAGWAAHLAGRLPSPGQLLRTRDLWQIETRIGVCLDIASRRAADGQLFSAQAVAMRPGIGFLVSVGGAEPPPAAMLRFGGDGRGAALQTARHQPAAVDLAAIARVRRARLLLTTPGLLAGGWRLPGCGADHRLHWPGLSARLACAAVPRADTISGWDLALRQPKTAERAVPAGSVYWLDEIDTTPEALGKLAAQGLWFDDHQNTPRRAEGFNRYTFAAW